MCVAVMDRFLQVRNTFFNSCLDEEACSKTVFLKEFRIYPLFINLRTYKMCSLCKPCIM